MARRPPPPFKASIGKRRLSDSDRVSEADFTRQVRDAMKLVVAEVQAWANHMNGASAEVLAYALEPAFELSQVYVPVRKGDLKRSGYLETRTFRGRAVADIGYSRGGIPHYGVYVHENLDVYHAPPTQAKFLERAILESENDIVARIREGLKQASGTAGKG